MLRISHATSPLPFPWREGKHRAFPESDLLDRLAYGALPGIVTAEERDRPGLLKTYAVVHLEEEIRREALVKDWGAFVRFLQLAAAESGQVLNYSNISQESGISQPTVKSHYQLLEDMFVGIRVPAYSQTPRKKRALDPEISVFRLGHPSCGGGMESIPRDGEVQSRSSLRAVGGNRTVAAPSVSRRGKAVSPAHTRRSGSGLHYREGRCPDTDRSQMDRASDGG